MTKLTPQVNGITLPAPTELSQPYWDGTREGELRYQRCARCEAANFGPGLACSTCRSLDLTWEVSAGRGVLYSWTVMWRPPTPAFEAPYAPAIVRMAEGYDQLSAVIGCEPDDLEAEMALTVEFHRVTDHITLPFFAPS